MEDFKYLRITLTYKNSIEEENKSRLKSGKLAIILLCFVFQFDIKNFKIKIHRSTILPVVLNGCETWSFTLREERRLRLFENRVLRRIFGPKRDEVTGEWRKLHNEEFNDLYSSSSVVRVKKSRRMRWAGYVACMGRGEERHIQGFGGKT